jgi:hypothetical protein
MPESHIGRRRQLKESAMVRSLIVGPRAVARVIGCDGQEIMKLPSCKLVVDVFKLGMRTRAARIHVEKI